MVKKGYDKLQEWKENIKEWTVDSTEASAELVKTALPYVIAGKVLGAGFGLFFLGDISNGVWDNIPFYNFLENLGAPGVYFGQLMGGYLAIPIAPSLLYKKELSNKLH